ncbi:hypothetical protein A3C17_03140 [Candidatus Uhrbacteria bacterium RIFCSPHIGHO2_02_FULL_53_13]|uniref:Uncharacterized protein n=2 Tax=Candidatus Uhriibacteriota TaxID=1752732 RepID=A0A1F7TW68_9BACT|nr:MAG: hypothetical protein A3C17_03140 [Candidatus Uhrbacteria bacterium RIFCSPHIGHO2_02_FULL_53_13]OGL89184.1 MAG: hypothetical protein A3I45_01060 [Candidatus Uhrbacteria bacterium RIFCSPLOWO2_02_FULL_53_10]
MNKKIPKQVAELLNTLAKECQSVLGDTFVGFYVHGSLAMGCFNHELSDVDFLVVVNSPLHSETRKNLMAVLIQHSRKAPPKGFEMSVVIENHMQNFVYPTPFEMHFRSDQIEKYKAAPPYGTENGLDPDLAAHATITKERGICLLGKPINEVFPDIPKEYYLKSIIRDSEESIQNIMNGVNSGTCSVPAYGVLNLCRVLAFIDDGLITSKQEGGEWALKNLPKKYSNTIRQALNKYTGSDKLQEVEVSVLKDFARYAKEKW